MKPESLKSKPQTPHTQATSARESNSQPICPENSGADTTLPVSQRTASESAALTSSHTVYSDDKVPNTHNSGKQSAPVTSHHQTNSSASTNRTDVQNPVTVDFFWFCFVFFLMLWKYYVWGLLRQDTHKETHMCTQTPTQIIFASFS